MEELLVYIDVLFFYNFIIDFLLLWVTGVATGRRASLRRFISGSCLGALYACLTVAARFGKLLSAGVGFLVSCLMVVLAFGRLRQVEFIKLILVYYLMNFMLAGGISFSGGLFRSSHGIAALAVLSGLVILYCFSGIYFHIIKKSMIAGAKTLSIWYNGKQIDLKAFPDTGNNLTEPLERLGVIVVKANCLKEIADFEHPHTLRNLRMIPCSTVTEGRGILFGFKPDSIVCDEKPVRAVIAISDKLQMEDYDAIVNPIILI